MNVRVVADVAPDSEVIDAVRAGDAARFEVLMRRHNELVYRTIRSILPEPQVEEAMQHTYLNAYRALDRFQGRARFSTWLVRIAVNAALAVARQGQHDARRRAALEAEIVELHPNLDTPERNMARQELRTILEHSIDRLTEGHRLVFMLADVHGMSGPEIAAALDLTEQTVRTRLSRARQQLRDIISETLGEVTPETFRFYRPRCDRVVAAVLAELEPW